MSKSPMQKKTSRKEPAARKEQSEAIAVAVRTLDVPPTHMQITSSRFPIMPLSSDGSGGLAVAITSPQNNATLTDKSPAVDITISGNVRTDQATAEQVLVQLGERADWNPAALEDDNWSFTGKVFEPGSLKILAKAVGMTNPPDPKPVEDTEEITITVAMTDITPPELTITSPQNEITVYGDGKVTRVPVRVEASDPVTGISQIVWYLDDKEHLTEKFAPAVKKWSGTREVRIPAAKFEPSKNEVPHTIKVACTDAAGNSTVQSVTVKEVDITPPFYEIIEPRNGIKISANDDDAEILIPSWQIH